MPRATYFNLDPDKQERIFAAAVAEFAARPFSEASINQIVKKAGISRGSFYQYFENKEDLYLYMIAEIGKEKMQRFEQARVFATEADFFTTYLELYKIGLAWVQEKPEYNRIFLLMELDDSDFIAKLRALSAEGFDILKGLLERDKERGLIRPDVDSDLVIDIVYDLMLQSFKRYYQRGSEEKLRRRVEGILQIIKEGIGVKDRGEG
ncbi:MAG TPA: TetR/AcrR family transcriptional regulator [Firmicutes bacterium]|nr:TetR/AcrR family transcriptional regulator [Bacillota bacterium]